MSRGPGAVERSIAAIMAADVSNAFTVADLVSRIYPAALTIEKKHRVSIIRAMRSVASRSSDVGIQEARGRGGTLIVFHELDAISCAMAALKAEPVMRWRPISEADMRASLAPGGARHNWVSEGGHYWRAAELRRARRDGRTAIVDQFETEIAAEKSAWLSVGRSLLSRR